MSFESVLEMLADVPRLLVQVEKSPYVAERAAAVKRLQAIYAILEADLREAEASLASGINRRVEIAALRSALSTLSIEMALSGADRFPIETGLTGTTERA